MKILISSLAKCSVFLVGESEVLDDKHLILDHFSFSDSSQVLPEASIFLKKVYTPSGDFAFKALPGFRTIVIDH